MAFDPHNPICFCKSYGKRQEEETLTHTTLITRSPYIHMEMSNGDIERGTMRREKTLSVEEQKYFHDNGNKSNTLGKKEGIPMFWGFHGLWLLMPLFLLGKFFWLIILGLLIWALIRRFSSRRPWAHYYRQEPFYNPGMHPGTPPTQHSAMEILRQRYARGEIDATTFDQMRERLESSSGPSQQ